jgi:hypothetical protein
MAFEVAAVTLPIAVEAKLPVKLPIPLDGDLSENPESNSRRSLRPTS